MELLFEHKNFGVDKLTHLAHAEDFPLLHGNQGFNAVTSTLLKVHDYLTGKRPPGFTISQKWDGAPALIFGHNPETGQFFVATKSAFNKTPKLNYSSEDIEKNHAKAPGLVKKLKDAFEALRHASPKTGVFQGDLMYSGKDVEEKGSNLTFTPNTLTYSVDKHSPEGRRVANSKIGIVVHTEYKGSDIQNMKANLYVDQKRFHNNHLVDFIDPMVHPNVKYTPHAEKDFAMNLMRARALNKDLIKTKAYDAIQGHEELLMTYVNYAVRSAKDPTLHGYISFIKMRYTKLTNDAKKPETKLRRQDVEDTLIGHILDNKVGLNDMFKLHKTLQDTKNILVNVMSDAESPYKTTMHGKATKPEGFVATNNGIPLKLVDRKEFSAANLNKGKFNSEAFAASDSMVFSFGRMNPPTIGHEKMIQMVRDHARQIGANYKIVMSATTDSMKNPLDPKKKLEYAKLAFPDTNIEVAGNKEKTIIDQLKKLSNQGIKILTVVTGDDRKKEFETLINKYNGKKDSFKFKKINFISAGKRDPKAKGTESASASKVRAAAKSGDFNTFRAGIPKTMNDQAAKRMFKDVRTKYGVGVEEKPPEINDKTPGTSLARWSKHPAGDRTGNSARQEIRRRRQKGIWRGKTA